jgi:cytochrome c-type biogenesis protein CcmH/NrfF
MEAHVTLADLLWLIPLIAVVAAVARRMRIGRHRREEAIQDELEKYLADCEGRPHPIIRYR